MKWLMNSYKTTEDSNETTDKDSFVLVCTASTAPLVTLIIVQGSAFV